MIAPKMRFSFLGFNFGLFAAFVALCACVLLYPGVHGGFILDDLPNIVQNGALRIDRFDLEALAYAAYSFQPGGGTRPLSMLSFALDYWRGGMSPLPFKETNLAIHASSVFLLAFLLRTVFLFEGWSKDRSVVAALLLAFVWGIHPLQVSSVLYVVQRMQTLATFFLLLAFICYFKARTAQISGLPSRVWWCLILLCWGFAFLCKEDSVLFPAFTTALEITLLRFRSADPLVSRRLRLFYQVGSMMAAVLFFSVVVPHYWRWDVYPGRSFTTWERLMTQARVLNMYLGQMFFPLPANLPFYYDGFIVSKGVFQPASTALSIFTILILLLSSWWLRKIRPLMSLGLFIFFIGHFITSNVIALELAFEHRNQIPLLGLLIAVADLTSVLWRKFVFNSAGILLANIMIVGAVAAISAAELARVRIWANPLYFAEQSVIYAPESVRARLVLCTTYFELSGQKKDSPYLDKAIQTCEKGVGLSDSATLLQNVLIYKTIQGTVTDADWDRFFWKLKNSEMSPQNIKMAWVSINNALRENPKMDERRVVETIEIISSRATLSVNEYLRMAQFVLNDSTQPDAAYPHLVRAIGVSKINDPEILVMLTKLELAGYDAWSTKLRRIAREQGKLNG